MNERETVFHQSSMPPDALRRHGRTSGGPTSIIVSSTAAWKLVAIRKIRASRGLVVNGVRAGSEIGLVASVADGTLARVRGCRGRGSTGRRVLTENEAEAGCDARPRAPPASSSRPIDQKRMVLSSPLHRHPGHRQAPVPDLLDRSPVGSKGTSPCLCSLRRPKRPTSRY